jgi:hypothetical protein
VATIAVRVPSEELELIQKWAEDRKITPGGMIAALAREHEERMFWEEMREDFERLRSDPVAWKDYQDEAAVLEGGSMDGLDKEEPYYTVEEEAEIEARARSKGW